MTALLKNIIFSLSFVLLSFALVTQVSAAAPDGAGPWADNVTSSSQGLMKNGSPVPAARSNPTAALGVAENDTVDSHFFSLGFGGKIALGFDNGISSGVIVVEATNPNYPYEKAKVEVSENGTTWVNAGEVTQDGSVNKPDGVGCARFVRVTDVSNPEDFSDATADGYDVDGVKATGQSCTPPTSGGGNCTSTVVQKNNTIVSNSTTSVSNTGGNSTSFNTGGSNSITTGNTNTTVTNQTTGGSNTSSGGCCCGGSTNASISNTGAGSTNVINIGSSKKAKKISRF